MGAISQKLLRGVAADRSFNDPPYLTMSDTP
jgi:hypothetical protein